MRSTCILTQKGSRMPLLRASYRTGRRASTTAADTFISPSRPTPTARRHPQATRCRHSTPKIHWREKSGFRTLRIRRPKSRCAKPSKGKKSRQSKERSAAEMNEPTTRSTTRPRLIPGGPSRICITRGAIMRLRRARECRRACSRRTEPTSPPPRTGAWETPTDSTRPAGRSLIERRAKGRLPTKGGAAKN
jgi:hypothetical protein